MSIVPVLAQRLNVYVAQRYDVLVSANQIPGNYWIRANTLAHPTDDSKQILAIFHYDAPGVPMPANNNTGDGEPETERWGSESTQVNLFSALNPLGSTGVPQATRIVTVSLECSETSYHCSMNHTQFRLPTYPIGLSVYEGTPCKAATW